MNWIGLLRKLMTQVSLKQRRPLEFICVQSVIFYFWCLLSTISLHIFQYRAPTQDQFCFANQNLDHSICSPQVWNPNGKQAGSYAVLFYSTRALFRHSHLLMTPSKETQGSDYFGQPENETPTLQLVDDLFYLLCHRRGVSGKHNQHEYHWLRTYIQGVQNY